MGSIEKFNGTGTDTASPEAPSTVVAAIEEELKNVEDPGDGSDGEPPFALYGLFSYAEASLIDWLIGPLVYLVERSYVL